MVANQGCTQYKRKRGFVPRAAMGKKWHAPAQPRLQWLFFADAERAMNQPDLQQGKRLVIFGASNILSDLCDCALAAGLQPSRVVLHLPDAGDERSIALAARLQALAPWCPPPALQQFADFAPREGEVYLLGPTTPARETLARELRERFGLTFFTLIHPGAHVSPMSRLGEGCFVGAGSVIAPGAVLGEHVFVNRGATIGHDTHIGDFSRVQPGANLGGLSRLGRGVTVAIGATLVERLVVGDRAFIGAGALITHDVAADALVLAAPSQVRKSLA
jgi:sugar O-acyltransferase (sialic acid O-acetyltransferase NeuD family)